MKTIKLFALLAVSLSLMSAGWRMDFESAKSDARKEHKLVLLKFSGSDWCLPCIRMEKNIFSTDTFQAFANANLEMVNADFPRLSKNKLSKTITAQNESLAERYDKDGHFPYTLLLDADGKVLKSWDGYVGNEPAEFIRQISNFTEK